jgi:hypothetical protein
MNSRFTSALVVAATLWAGSAVAGSTTKKATIRLDRAALVGSTLIEPGTYQLELAPAGDTVRFVQGKRTVTEAPCSVGLEQPLYAGTAIHYRTGSGGADRLVRIVFADSKLAIQFPAEGTGGTDASLAKAADRR